LAVKQVFNIIFGNVMARSRSGTCAENFRFMGLSKYKAAASGKQP
jgi:hypothetical protein